MWDPVEGVRRAVINTARRLSCRGDEYAVNTFWQLTINSPTQRPRVTARGKAVIAFFGCATASHPGLRCSKWHPDAVIALLDRAQWK